MCLGQMVASIPTGFDVHPADLPSTAAQNTAIHPDESLAAITALKPNNSSDLHGMQSDIIIDVASHLASPVSAVKRYKSADR